MKRLILLISFLYVFGNVNANPIPEFLPPVISELYFDSTGWYIELYVSGDNWMPNLDGCTLMSNDGYVYFNSGIDCPFEEPFLIDQSFLQEPLIIDPEADYLRLYSTYGYLTGSEYAEDFIYGDWSDYVSAPNEGESIGYYEIWYGNEPWERTYKLAKNCPPTPGYDPFEENGQGSIEGYVYDVNGYTVPDAYVELGGYTNEEGYFYNQCGYCRKYWMLEVTFNDEVVGTYYTTIEPNDTAFVEINTTVNLSGIEQFSDQELLVYNWPNPFERNTVFHFNLPDEQFCQIGQIEIRDIKEELVNIIGFSTTEKKINFENTNLGRGLYLYTLVLNGKPYSTNKMIIR